MPGAIVREDQFEVDGHEVTHTPTGARWSAYPRRLEPHIKNLGMLGSVLPNGDDYREDEVERVALKLLAARPLD